MIHEPLIFVLRSGRDEFNAKFGAARQRFPNLDGAAFQHFLRSTVDPLAQACPLPNEQLTAFIVAAYDIGLQLTGEHLCGNDPRSRLLGEAWKKIVPAAWALLAANPAPFLGAISNAVHVLSATRGARAHDWVDQMAALAPRGVDATTLLQLGQILAWRAGLAHFRTGALELAAVLPTPLVRAALGVGVAADWPAVFARLQRDPWYDPASDDPQATKPIRVVTKAGSFRGLGGPFTVPPTVAATGGQLFVASGDQHWLLLADAFGHSFHHASAEEFHAANRDITGRSAVRATGDTIAIRGHALPSPLPGPLSSVAVLPGTVALTSAQTYSVVLIAG